MGTLLIMGLVFVLVTFYWIMEFYADSISEYFMAATLGFLFSLLAGLLVMLTGLLASDSPTDPTKTPIYAIKDNSEVRGDFALGFGTVDEEQYYYYVAQDKKGFKRIEKAPVDDSRLKEVNIDKPYVKEYEHRYDSAFARFMYGEYSGEKSYEFYVPKNTVTTDYAVDLE